VYRNIYERLFEESSLGFVHNKMIFDENHQAIDFIIMNVNQAYLTQMNATRDQLIGKPISLFSNETNAHLGNWIKSYEQVFSTDKTIEFIQYSALLRKTFFVKAFKISEDEFVASIDLYDSYKQTYESAKIEQNLILNAIAEGIIVVSNDFLITHINQSANHILGHDNDLSLLGKDAFEVLFQDEQDLKRKLFRQTLSSLPLYNRVTQIRKADGTWIDVSVSILPKVGRTSDIGYVISFQDISQLQGLKRDLRQSEHTKQILVDHLPGMIYRCQVDEHWTMTYISEGVKTLTGYEVNEVLNNNQITFNDIIHPNYRKLLSKEWETIIANKKTFEKEYMIITKEGKNKWVYEQGKPIYDDLGNAIALEGIIIDLNKRRERDLEIEHMIYHDQLTGLKNRLYFDESIALLDEQGAYPFGVLIANIDNMKMINDNFGRAAGDQVILDFTSILRNYEKKDIVVARTGGDEFTMLLKSSSSQATYDTMIEIQEKAKAFSYQDPSGLSYQLTVSCGFETKLDQKTSIKDIIRSAEDFMHRRKLLAHSRSNRDSLSSIKATMIANSQETQDHMERMGEIALRVGVKLGLKQTTMDDLYLLAMLHDIGKIGVPFHIINKPGPLTEDEWEVMKRHPLIGYQIAISSVDLKPIAEGILNHHERFDGKGYPNQVKGRDIPLIARIVSIIDAYDAITQDRPYRPKKSHEAAMAEIKKHAGTQFDPDIVEVFVHIFE
jgi:diguanylate cyclase (GGDEF)-like protein/PAS domain S-box-containing protein